jgi:hypothetical protein
MRDSSDARLRWLFTRLEAEERCDVSDATIAYFLLTGDETCDPQKLAALLDKKQRPAVNDIRRTIRLEAENFRVLENCKPVEARKRASQNVLVRLSGAPKGILRTEFDEIHTARSGRYAMGVRYRGGGAGETTFALRVNGTPQGGAWRASAGQKAWKSHTVKEVFLARGDKIEIAMEAEGQGRGEVDFVELTHLDDRRS